jgi:cephalosporin hydroxylase
LADKIKEFNDECGERIASYPHNEALQQASKTFMIESTEPKYSYNFSWMGRPIIQYPQDMLAMQEIIWQIKPDLIIETGVAHGGSLVFSASILELIASFGGDEGEVLGIDIDIRTHNRNAIENHPMFKRITMIEGSSVSSEVIEQVRAKAEGKQRVLVCLDSNHTHEHVLEELKLYAPLTTLGSYCVVFDTVVEDLPGETFPDRPWGKGNNPKTAVWEYLKSHDEFMIDKALENKLLITVAPDGYLKRVK